MNLEVLHKYIHPLKVAGGAENVWWQHAVSTHAGRRPTAAHCASIEFYPPPPPPPESKSKTKLEASKTLLIRYGSGSQEKRRTVLYSRDCTY